MDPTFPLSLSSLSAVELADLLLLLMTQRRYAALLLEPEEEAHTLTVELEVGASAQAVTGTNTQPPPIKLPVALGDAVIARLMLLASLDVASPQEKLGKLSVGVGGNISELLLSVRVSAWGLSAELRRLVARASPEVESVTNHIEVYRILGELGKGAIGTVYRAEHKSLGRPVAIKILQPQQAKNPLSNERFLREARAASRIQDPGVVQVLDFGTLPNGQAFLVMELVSGKTLHEILRESGPLDPGRAIFFAYQLARALQSVHRGGIVHRDIKPANIFVEGDDRLKLGDFGAAKGIEPGLTPDLTQPGVVFGTPLYMSPEQARGLPLDQRSDLYSLGCVLFEMLTGRPPFLRKTPFDILVAHIGAPVPEVSSPHFPLPGLVCRIVERALAKDVEERYQNAAELCLDLERAEQVLSRRGWRRWLPEPL